MSYFIVGLGNPGEKYVHTRHNVGRHIVHEFGERFDLSWQYDKYADAIIAKGVISEVEVRLLLPETYMNRSGESLRPYVKDIESPSRVIVVYDDIDLPIGSIKISYARGSGGHKGVESVINILGTREFTRLRIGISPTTDEGAVQKLSGDSVVQKYVLGTFSADERTLIENVSKRTHNALLKILTSGKEEAMNIYNQ